MVAIILKAPFLTKFRHTLFDLSQADPTTEEGDVVGPAVSGVSREGQSFVERGDEGCDWFEAA